MQFKDGLASRVRDSQRHGDGNGVTIRIQRRSPDSTSRKNAIVRIATIRCPSIPYRVMSLYPPKLQAIIDLFESLPEEEKRENLVAYSEQAKKHEPQAGETFALEDVRKDEECTDTVGIFLKVDEKGGVHFNVTLGPQVQTLTKAM